MKTPTTGQQHKARNWLPFKEPGIHKTILSSIWGKAENVMTETASAEGKEKEREPVLVTHRLILRPFQLADAGRVQELASARAIAATTLNIPHPYEDGMAEAWIQTHPDAYASGEALHFAITRKLEGDLIGAIGCLIDKIHNRAEMGYWIGVPFWGVGYCTEAAEAILQFSFEVLGLQRVHAYHMTSNPASGRVMQKIGMLHEGTLRKHLFKWGTYHDVEIYGLCQSAP